VEPKVLGPPVLDQVLVLKLVLAHVERAPVDGLKGEHFCKGRHSDDNREREGKEEEGGEEKGSRNVAVATYSSIVQVVL
jgi:hypothetical protein